MYHAEPNKNPTRAPNTEPAIVVHELATFVTASKAKIDNNDAILQSLPKT